MNLLLLLSALSAPPCPAARSLPQLNILEIEPATTPLARHLFVEDWQVFLEGAPLSDAQLAALALDDIMTEELHAEVEGRAAMVYAGLLVASLGTALSSTGWVLFGQDQLGEGVTLPLALGGLVVGVGGLLFVNHYIQTPLESHLAPTPIHRVSREKARELVAVVNQRWLNQVCASAAAD